MPAIPVPYTQNWDSYFGSQTAPVNQDPAIPDIVVAAAPTVSAAMLATINDTHASPMKVDWGDGVVEAHASGAQTHQYTREGAYRVRVWLTSFPDVYVDHLLRVVDGRAKDITLVIVGRNVSFSNPIGIILPATLDWGDGTNPRYISKATEWPEHTYAAAGNYKISIFDAEATRINKQTGAIAATVHFDPPYPWEGFSVHQAINDWVEDQDLLVPPTWFQGTLAEKKAYLAATFGNG